MSHAAAGALVWDLLVPRTHWLLVFIALHVGAVIGQRWFKRRNLIGPMATGRRPPGEVPANASISRSRVGLALLLIVLCAAALTVAVQLAPATEISLAF